eukprot:CAMPEP_0116047434 /NCGR_PEP_ID=MMETSP0321-20121206/28895_1 /TAXON_ID=163516 /ORGANISM="Leptocylindrus danicus var. danicus, Strain B650" /LENGTH=811 /DNA_ID=CAMNT_0003529325 /DNA_START=180 /DNA_END=2616 /DNA_ORIENTATION=+
MIVGIAVVNMIILQRALSDGSSDDNNHNGMDEYGSNPSNAHTQGKQNVVASSGIVGSTINQQNKQKQQNNQSQQQLLRPVGENKPNQLLKNGIETVDTANQNRNKSIKSNHDKSNGNGGNDSVEADAKKIELRELNANDAGNVHAPILTAYAEPTFDYMAKPLPSRLHLTPGSLTSVEYSQVNSCSNLSGQFPINDEDSPPVELDPFLPWIHDVFPNAQGDKIHFVAQHRRRCHVGKPDWLERFMPQGSLFQHVPIKRTGKTNADGTTQYQLTSHEEADDDGIMTRFICRFHSITSDEIYETLSVFPHDYDYTTFRKGYPATFTEAGKDVHMVWSSQLAFDCPVPEALQTIIKSGHGVVDDYATVFLDLVPIRTATRFNAPKEFLAPKFNIPNSIKTTDMWGDDYILPPIESSGRIANIPICQPPSLAVVGSGGEKDIDATNEVVTKDPAKEPAVDAEAVETGVTVVGLNENEKKPHELVACTWASTNFLTRQNAANVKDGDRRLKEWIQHNLNVGFDHVYVYDNSGAFSKENSLKPVTDLFPPDKVTRIDWPAQICNNNLARVTDKGERSSQYAADASCRIRYGPQTKWLSFIDTDEYIVPVGKYDSLKSLFRDIEEKEDKKIINFYSARAKPHFKHIEFMKDGAPMPKADVPFLEAYNCEKEPPPKTFWMPAEKQIYRPDYVLHHFIHYPTVSTQSMMSEKETKEAGVTWRQRHNEERMGSARWIDELTEATMIHTKAVTIAEIGTGWEKKCKLQSCHFGFAFPEGEGLGEKKKQKDSDGNVMNCYPNPTVAKKWVPKLREELAKLEAR